MPIRIQSDLPAKAELEDENIFVMDENRALSQDFRELRIVILNLMPIKQDTELQLLRGLSNTPLQIDVTFLQMESHVSKNTSVSHLRKFYVTFPEIMRKKFDGMIITGAPVEKMDFEQVDYWDELTRIMEWSKTHVTSTLHICWGAQAGLYYHYGVKKVLLDKKLSGVYRHHVMNKREPLVRGFDDFSWHLIRDIQKPAVKIYFLIQILKYLRIPKKPEFILLWKKKENRYLLWDIRNMTV